jgi:hypothetical protein
MSEPTVERLFDEFARAYLRGERLDVREYLARAGAERDELASMLDRFLRAVPAREPSEEEIVLMQARLEQEPPLLVLRRDRRKLGRAAVVDALVAALGLDPAQRDKVAGYYHELEIGLLDPKPVSAKVWDVLGEFLQANVRLLAGLRPPPLGVAKPHYRRADRDLGALYSIEEVRTFAFDTKIESVSSPVPAEPPPVRDEIDELFTGVS